MGSQRRMSGLERCQDGRCEGVGDYAKPSTGSSSCSLRRAGDAFPMTLAMPSYTLRALSDHSGLDGPPVKAASAAFFSSWVSSRRAGSVCTGIT